jgi:predicted  nucleic acid-binding Zn-ribbon protein
VTAALAKERGHLDEIETRGLERLEQIEGAMKGLAELKKKQAVIAEELAGLERQSNAIIAAQQAIIDQHTLARAPIVAAVEEGLREQYEVANRQNPGSAICLVKPGECLGCAGELTQQHVSEVRARNKVVRCPYCRRIQDMRA